MVLESLREKDSMVQTKYVEQYTQEYRLILPRLS